MYDRWLPSFQESHCLHLQDGSAFVCSEYGNSGFFQNTGNHLSDYMLDPLYFHYCENVRWIHSKAWGWDNGNYINRSLNYIILLETSRCTLVI
jgi:hypothetical protein